MAKKYHIDAHGKVVPCQAFLRKCPRTDYNSQEAAYSALYIQEEGNKLAAARAEVERVMKDVNAHSAFIAADFSGEGNEKNPRTFAQKVDQEFFEKGEYPQKIYASVPLSRKYIDNRKNPIALSINRIPVADYDEGVIKGKWSLQTEMKNQSGDPIVLELDLENDYEEETERAERYIRDVVMRTSPSNFTPEHIESETNNMMDQLESAFTQIEEEASGPYALWEKNPSAGSFADSDMFNVKVNVDYNTTLFRGRTFDRFLNDENGYFTSVSPELNIQVYDNENGQSDTSWRIVRHDGNWFLQTVDRNGKINPQQIESAEDGYQRMYDFVSTQMRTSSPKIAEEKARYVADLMTEVELAIETNNRIKDKRHGRMSQIEDTQKKKNDNRSLFGESSSTMNSILDMYA